MKIIRGFLLGIVFIYFFANVNEGLAQEDAASIIKLIQEKAQAIRSYQAGFTLKMQGPQGEMLMQGSILFKRPDRIKMEMAMPNIPDAKQLMVSDGNTMWQFVSFIKTASKVDLASLKKEFGDTYFTQPKEDISKPLKELEENSLKYLGKETLEGKEFFVLEAKPRTSGQEGLPPFAKVKVWIDITYGLEKKTVFYDSEGKEVFSRNFAEIKTNLEIADAEFIFSPPEGTEVMDMTEDTRKIIEAEKKGVSPSGVTPELPPPVKH